MKRTCTRCVAECLASRTSWENSRGGGANTNGSGHDTTTVVVIRGGREILGENRFVPRETASPSTSRSKTVKRNSSTSTSSSNGQSTPFAHCPVIIVPGFASSVLEVKESTLKPKWVGKSVWVTMSKLVNKVIDFRSQKSNNNNGNGESSGANLPHPIDTSQNEKRTADEEDSESDEDLLINPGNWINGSPVRRRVASDFVPQRQSNKELLARSHPLVRHITLDGDGLTDPPGIKVCVAVVYTKVLA